MRKSIIKKKKNTKWMKWAPLVLVLLMIGPVFIFFGTTETKSSVTLQFQIGELLPVETISVNENESLMSIINPYSPVIYDNKIYCLRNLCLDQGNWTFYSNGEEISPFSYYLKDKDRILVVFE